MRPLLPPQTIIENFIPSSFLLGQQQIFSSLSLYKGRTNEFLLRLVMNVSNLLQDISTPKVEPHPSSRCDSQGGRYQRLVSFIGSNIPLQKGLAKWLADFAPNFRGYQHTVRKVVNGFDYELNLGDFVQRRMYYLGLYDAEGVRLVTKIVRILGCRTALDVGANVGNHAVFLGDFCTSVYCFEPNDSPRSVFEAALVNKPSTHIRVLDFGLAERDELATFYEYGFSLGMSSFEGDASHAGASVEKRLRIRRGDDVIAELGVADIDFIKIDVEGFEKEVLCGLRNVIATQQPVVDFEFHAVTRNKLKTISALEELLPDYTLYGARRPIKAIKQYCALYGLRATILQFLSTHKALVPFQFEQEYAHVVAVPKHLSDLVRQLELGE